MKEIEALQMKCKSREKIFNDKEKEWLSIKYDYDKKIVTLNDALKVKSWPLAEHIKQKIVL